jgi:hypothetical protein
MDSKKHFFNVISNIPYILLGLIVFETVSFMWGLGIVVLGIGSYYSHLVLQKKSWIYDWAGMFLAFTLQSAFFLQLLTGWDFWYVVAIVLSGILTIEFEVHRSVRYSFSLIEFLKIKINLNHVILLGLYILSSILSFFVVNFRYALTSLLFYIIAIVIRRWSHSIWHLLTAVGILILLLGVIDVVGVW